MGQIKGLIDEFSKLTGELQVENTFDINFWNVQITEFANIVMQTIRHMDHQFQLNSKLEYAFGLEFQKQWQKYRSTQEKILNGELPMDYGAKERNINHFNMVPEYKQIDIPSNNNDVIISDESEEKTYNEQEYNNDMLEKQLMNDVYFDSIPDDEPGEMISTDNFISNVDEINTIQTDIQKNIEQENEKMSRIAIVKQLLNNKQPIIKKEEEEPKKEKKPTLTREEVLAKLKKKK